MKVPDQAHFRKRTILDSLICALYLYCVLYAVVFVGSWHSTNSVLSLNVFFARNADWFKAGPAHGRWRAFQYLIRRARLNLAMLEQLDLVNRTAELAKTFGIDFYAVLSRGSQYRVESMLLRLAHTQNCLCPSPTREQV